MKSVLKLPVCHFSYVNLVTEGALIIFFPEKKRQGALIGAGALNGANTVNYTANHILVQWFHIASCSDSLTVWVIHFQFGVSGGGWGMQCHRIVA